MSVRGNGSYLGPRPTGPTTSVASGWWDLRNQFRYKRDATWPGVQLRYLVVAGGGGGGGAFPQYTGGGGGGGGEVTEGTALITPGSSITVTVGGGGTAGVAIPGTAHTLPSNGTGSAFGSVSAAGGGSGGVWSVAPASGGSGGGGAHLGGGDGGEDRGSQPASGRFVEGRSDRRSGRQQFRMVQIGEGGAGMHVARLGRRSFELAGQADAPAA